MTSWELAGRIAGVLRGMSALSEVGAVNYSGVRTGASKSSPPPGVVLGQRRDLRDLSLADYWQDKFRSAKGNVRQLEVFLFLAERDLSRALRRHEPPDPHEGREDREARVISQYAGMSPLEAALAEDCSEAWIRKVRGAAGMDPQTGVDPIVLSDVGT